MARVAISGRVAVANRVAIPATQNLLTRSEELANAVWNSSTAIAVTSDNTTAPDGTVSADLLTPSGGVNRHYAGQSFTVPVAYRFSPRVHSYSCFFKAGGGTQWMKIGDDRHTSFVDAWFDLTNGVVGTVTADNDTGILVAARIEPAARQFPSAPAGWWRCEMTFTMVSPGGGAGPNASGICVGPTTGDGVASFDSASGVTCWAWGAQMTTSRWSAQYAKTVAAAIDTGTPRSLCA